MTVHTFPGRSLFLPIQPNHTAKEYFLKTTHIEERDMKNGSTEIQ